jgi:hypothetical protein
MVHIDAFESIITDIRVCKNEIVLEWEDRRDRELNDLEGDCIGS